MLEQLFSVSDKRTKEIIKGMCGYSIKPSVLFGEKYNEDRKQKKVALTFFACPFRPTSVYPLPAVEEPRKTPERSRKTPRRTRRLMRISIC